MLSFRQFFVESIIGSGGQYHYTVPDNKEHLLYDYYQLNLLLHLSGMHAMPTKMPDNERNRWGGKKYKKLGIFDMPTMDYKKFRPGDIETRRDQLNYAIEEARKTLTPALKKEMLDVTFFAASAEMRHIYSSVYKDGFHYDDDDDLHYSPAELARKIGHDLGHRHQKALEKYNINLNRGYDSPITMNLKKLYEGSSIDRIYGYLAAEKVEDRTTMMEIAKWAFNSLEWEDGYGGENWGDIAEAYLTLKELKEPGHVWTYIDHIYDLQHNNGTVFNKLASYRNQAVQGWQSNHGWIQRALNHKAQVESAHELMEFVSPVMRNLTALAMYTYSGKTYESHGKEQSGIISKLASKTGLINEHNLFMFLIRKGHNDYMYNPDLARLIVQVTTETDISEAGKYYRAVTGRLMEKGDTYAVAADVSAINFKVAATYNYKDFIKTYISFKSIFDKLWPIAKNKPTKEALNKHAEEWYRLFSQGWSTFGNTLDSGQIDAIVKMISLTKQQYPTGQPDDGNKFNAAKKIASQSLPGKYADIAVWYFYTKKWFYWQHGTAGHAGYAGYTS